MPRPKHRKRYSKRKAMTLQDQYQDVRAPGRYSITPVSLWSRRLKRNRWKNMRRLKIEDICENIHLRRGRTYRSWSVGRTRTNYHRQQLAQAENALMRNKNM